MLRQSFIKLSYIKSNQVFSAKKSAKKKKFDINKFKHAEFNVLALLPYRWAYAYMVCTLYIVHSAYANTSTKNYAV